ncbi:NAD(P)/FAD-dependent oxidoreductase [Chromobacterium haemolyticum]|uniref:NAD(P)/FAD-dependent oxidoreductase n=1 Tax=Chromobacterium haemolyticum TaxID=394935 RepID=UPI00244B8BFE|nr:FAD-dependent oxidoreductase [Chromobacterium haemolyticum]MDH0340759.1 FAD-binding oxidoreductase [Chromobacterium haemolyticum]
MTTPCIVVVGGGILGCTIAARLLEREPRARLTLVDRGLVGAGASMYSAGVHFPVGRSERVRQLSAASADYYQTLRARHPRLPMHGFDFFVAAGAVDAEEVRARCAGLLPLSAEEKSRVAPDLPAGRELWRMPDCHVTDVQRLALWYAQHLRSRAEVLEGIGVEALDESADSVRLTLSSGRELAADAVVLAPGPWVNEGCWSGLTAGLGVRVKKVVALHIQRPAEEGAALFFPAEDAFLAPLPHRGHWLFSYTCQQWDVSPEQCRQARVEAREIAEARETLKGVAPDLESLAGSGRVFCDAYSPSREPLAQYLGRHRRILFAGACNGSGYRLAPGVAAEAVALLNHTFTMG